MSVRRSTLFLAWVTLAAWPCALASAQVDFAPESREWNGLASFVDLARSLGIEFETPSAVDLRALGPNDGLLILYPTTPLPSDELAAHMRRGARVAIADDFGSGDSLLNAFHIMREEVASQGVPRLRANPSLLLADAVCRHPLARGVVTLATNHPTSIAHAELEPVFAFESAEQHGVVLAGAVETGRLVAISDPSIFINNMLELPDNRRFAENLLRYLSSDGLGRIVLATAGTPIRGAAEPRSGGRLAAFDRALAVLADLDLPPLVAQLAALLLATLLFIAAISGLPHRSPYRMDQFITVPAPAGGSAGRIAFFLRRQDRLAQPALAIRLELEDALARSLGIPQPLELDYTALSERCRARGLSRENANHLVKLLTEFDLIAAADAHHRGASRLGPRRLRRIVAQTRALLVALRRTPSNLAGRAR